MAFTTLVPASYVRFADTAPGSPKTSNPDTTILCTLLMPPFQTPQARPVPLGHIRNSRHFPAAMVNSEQVYLHTDKQDLVSTM